jgi:hypothetical protein
MNKFIAPILTGLLLAGGVFAAAKPSPGKGRICPQVIGGKCSEHQKKQIPHCKENPGFGSKCRPHGPF